MSIPWHRIVLGEVNVYACAKRMYIFLWSEESSSALIIDSRVNKCMMWSQNCSCLLSFLYEVHVILNSSLLFVTGLICKLADCAKFPLLYVTDHQTDAARSYGVPNPADVASASFRCRLAGSRGAGCARLCSCSGCSVRVTLGGRWRSASHVVRPPPDPPSIEWCCAVWRPGSVPCFCGVCSALCPCAPGSWRCRMVDVVCHRHR